MNKEKYKLLKELASLTLTTEIIGFIGVILNTIGKDLNLKQTSELGLMTWISTLIFNTLAFITLIIEYKKKQRIFAEKETGHEKSKSKQN